jgi:hypothetical protein
LPIPVGFLSRAMRSSVFALERARDLVRLAVLGH